MFVSYLKSTNNQFLASQSSHYDKVTFSAALNRYLLGLHEMKCYAVSVKFKFLKRVYTWCIPIEPKSNGMPEFSERNDRARKN